MLGVVNDLDFNSSLRINWNNYNANTFDKQYNSADLMPTSLGPVTGSNIHFCRCWSLNSETPSELLNKHELLAFIQLLKWEV